MNWEIKRYPMVKGGIKKVYPNVKPGTPFFSKSVKVGNLLYLSATNGSRLDTGDVPSTDFKEQMTASLGNIKLALEEADSSLDNLVRTLILIRDRDHFSVAWKTLLEYYQKNAPKLVEDPPAVTVIQIGSLSKSEYLVEIDAIAVASRNEPGWEIKKCPLYRNGLKQVYPNIKPGTPFCSESVRVGNLIFLSNVTGEDIDTGTVNSDILEDQMTVIHEKIRTGIEKNGSTLSNIIETFHYMTTMDLASPEIKDSRGGSSPATARMWKAELGYFEEHAPFLLDEPPSSTFMQVRSLGNPKCLIGADVIGVVSRDRPGWKMKKFPLYYGQRGLPRHLGDIKKYYANSVAVGNLLFISGKAAESKYTDRIETDIFKDQMNIALEKLRLTLEEAGSSLENLVKTIMLVPNLENREIMYQTELEYYQKHAPRLVDEPPATTFISPVSLATPKFLIEIYAVGFIP